MVLVWLFLSLAAVAILVCCLLCLGVAAYSCWDSAFCIVCLFEKKKNHSFIEKRDALPMIILDHFFLLIFYIAKQTMKKGCIQNWIPLQPNLIVLTKVTVLFYGKTTLLVLSQWGWFCFCPTNLIVLFYYSTFKIKSTFKDTIDLILKV